MYEFSKDNLANFNAEVIAEVIIKELSDGVYKIVKSNCNRLSMLNFFGKDMLTKLLNRNVRIVVEKVEGNHFSNFDFD